MTSFLISRNSMALRISQSFSESQEVCRVKRIMGQFWTMKCLNSSANKYISLSILVALNLRHIKSPSPFYLRLYQQFIRHIPPFLQPQRRAISMGPEDVQLNLPVYYRLILNGDHFHLNKGKCWTGCVNVVWVDSRLEFIQRHIRN